MLAAAWAVAVLHAVLVVFVIFGSLLALRWPRLAYLHAPLALLVLVVNATGQPCPLTVWELDLLEAAGAEPYTGGYLGHYVLAPFGVDVHTTTVQVGIYLTAVIPNLIGYSLLGRRAVGTRRPAERRAG